MNSDLRRWLDHRMLMARDRLRERAQGSRKVRKLIDDPRLFFADMVEKRAGSKTMETLRGVVRHPVGFVGERVRERAETRAWRRSRAPRRFTVVSAVYQVEPYLDAFFASLTSQSLDFDDFIELIVVDDGSTDGSAARIAAWRARHPGIRYVHKENGGQASARNVGLTYATGEWVTFIDPDDYVDRRYFERVDQLLERPDAHDVVLVGCKIVFDQNGVRRDTHALRSQFEDGDAFLPNDASSAHIQLSAASAFFRRDRIEAHDRRFDEQIRPNFEDAHFIGRYRLENPGGAIGVCARARYAYRKRADASSTLDGSWTDPRRFGVVWERGYLDLLRASAEASDDGRAALWAQRSVLYELSWFLQVLLNQGAAAAFLNEDERDTFKAHVRAAMAYIEPQTVMDFELAGAELLHKVGLLGARPDSEPVSRRVQLAGYDPAKRLFRIRYFYAGDAPGEVFALGEREIFPAFANVQRHDFLGDDFAFERTVWLPLRHDEGRFHVRLDGVEASFEEGEPPYASGIEADLIVAPRLRPEPEALPRMLRAEYVAATTGAKAARYRDALLFIDRDAHADDNAEHLYRFTARARPDLNVFFILRRSSVDWDRLEGEGFRLIPFGSGEHRAALMNAKHLISSHADTYITHWPAGRHWAQLRPPYFTFLQHGVINYDLSRWLNRKRIDCMVTTSPAEYGSIVGDGNYKFTAREVVLSGLPRYDALLARAAPTVPTLLICPTWRQHLAGSVGGGSSRTINPDFYESGFARTWKELLHSPELHTLLKQHGWRAQFLPHPNLKPYLSWFDVPSDIGCLSYGTGQSVQDIFAGASAMVTDYSSVAFEMAYLHRTALYYQFDREVMFGGGHTGGWGYFDYERDGFGPVCFDQADLLTAMSETLARGGAPTAAHRARMDRAFAYRDGRCCERTLDAVLALTDAEHPRDQTAPLLFESARSASQDGDWDRAVVYWQALVCTLGGASASAPGTELTAAKIALTQARRQAAERDRAKED